MKNSKKNRVKIYIICINIILFIFSFQVFYNLALWEKGDLLAHSLFAVNLLELSHVPFMEFLKSLKLPHIMSYPIWHIAYLIVRGLLWPTKHVIESFGFLYLQTIAAVTTSIFLLFTYNLYRKYFTKYLFGDNALRNAFLGLAVIFTGPYYLSTEESYMLAKGIVTPWHNPTTIAVQSISVICFFGYIKLHYSNEEKNTKKENINFLLFSLLLLVSAFIKPSFYQMFVPTLVIFCVLEFLLSKGKKFFFCLKTAFSVLPVCGLALAQMFISFGSTDNGFGFGFLEVLKLYTNHPIVSISISLIFTGFVLILAIINKCKDKKIWLAVCAVISGLGQYSCLYLIKGKYAADFAWGFYLALQLLVISCIIYFYNLCKEKKYKIIKYVGWGLYVPHVFCGLIYFLNMLNPDFHIFGTIYFDFWKR